MLTSLPNLLTLSRIVAIPAIVALFYVDGPTARWAAGVVFLFACLTDFLDGYFARTRSQYSDFGRFLDPVADKLLVAAVLFMLVGVGDIRGLSIVPALIILCREILVSGLREYLAGQQVGMPVTRLAKWKTAIQLFAIGFLVVGDAGAFLMPVHAIGIIGLWIAAGLTLVTGYDYVRSGLRHMEPPPGI